MSICRAGEVSGDVPAQINSSDSVCVFFRYVVVCVWPTPNTTPAHHHGQRISVQPTNLGATRNHLYNASESKPRSTATNRSNEPPRTNNGPDRRVCPSTDEHMRRRSTKDQRTQQQRPTTTAKGTENEVQQRTTDQRRTNERTNERTNQPTNQPTNQRTNQRTNEPTNERTNERTNEHQQPTTTAVSFHSLVGRRQPSVTVTVTESESESEQPLPLLRGHSLSASVPHSHCVTLTTGWYSFIAVFVIPWVLQVVLTVVWIIELIHMYTKRQLCR